MNACSMKLSQQHVIFQLKISDYNIQKKPMKFSLLVAAFGAFFLSSVEGIKSHKQGQDDQVPCAEDDDQCWLDYLGIDCQADDEECVKAALQDLLGDLDLPDCAEDDDECWQEWADSQDDGSSHKLRRHKRSSHAIAKAHAMKSLSHHFKVKN